MAQGRQSTLGKFLGKQQNGTKPKAQSTLAFNGKSNKKKTDATKPEDDDVDMTNGNDTNGHAAEASGDDSASKKHSRSPVEDEEDDSDDQPVVKRKRTTAPAARTAKASPKASPKVEKKNSESPVPTSTATKKSSSPVEEEDVSEEEEHSDSEGEKPEVKKKQAAKVQVALKSTGKDPYPDWKAGDPVPYAALCTTFSLVELTTKRLQIIAYCSAFLQQVLRLTPNDLLPTVMLMLNKLAADYAGIELGIGESLIMKAIGESSGRSLAVIKEDHRKIGDLGLVAAKSKSKQGQMFKPKALTVRGVHQGLLEIAKMEGHGSQDQKVRAINKLMASADVSSASKAVDINKDKGGASEAKFLVRFLEGKLRLGLAEKTVIVGLAQAVLAKGEAALKEVYSELPSYEVIIPAMLEHGIMKLHDSCKLQPGIHYVAPQAEKEYPAAESTLVKDPKSFKGLASIFSRNSEDLSKKYPDILEKLNTWIKPTTTSFVLDCETVAWDPQNKKVLPFQQLMTRKRKDVKTSDVTVKAFEPVEGEFAFAQYGDATDIDQIQTLLDDSVKASCEGLMVKMLDTEESGYEPSKRSRNWLKVKKDYLQGIGDSLDLVVLGAYYGKGKRTSWYGAFLLAVYNPDTQVFETVCNIGTGFSEQLLEELHSELSEIVIDKPTSDYSHSTTKNDQPDVWFKAKYVWEVKTADLTLSPRYRAAIEEMGAGKGISLRFPRFIKKRDDKKPEQATSAEQIKEMYQNQESVSKDAKTGIDDDFEY
ncbi:DNA ligase 1 [Cyphellophora attinorum]|uniref:DNA ligase 1 n=1 Tax=Cyphellophora attinorum TaxID=1664694 RepID=A0A0N1HPY4_9EURO|nr:DNA ligase 1 [Phialophora attinorum]KPI39900.1 DNA ligase 1 [Phialophora attinorum]